MEAWNGGVRGRLDVQGRKAHRTRGMQELRTASSRLIFMACCVSAYQVQIVCSRASSKAVRARPPGGIGVAAVESECVRIVRIYIDMCIRVFVYVRGCQCVTEVRCCF